MHASKHQSGFQQPRVEEGSRPLAGSVFTGEARLRELEHLAETARRVRDQAAAELTRSGSTHHVARDRIAAAERMLLKTQAEIAELRSQLGTGTRQAEPQSRDFELAVLLGHSSTRLNPNSPTQTLELQRDPVSRPRAAGKPGNGRAKSGHRDATSRFLLALGLMAGAGLAAAAVLTYAVTNDRTIEHAMQSVQGTAEQAIAKLRAP